VRQMRIDENEHAETAIRHGGAELPKAVRKIMQVAAKGMTSSTYYL